MRDVGESAAHGAASQGNRCKRPMPRVIVFFRNDDPSALSDVAHEQAIAAIFERYRVPQTIGVVPRHAVGSTHDPYGGRDTPLEENPEMVAFLRNYVERSGSEIALHGYTHRTSLLSRPSKREYFEFRGHSVEEQAERIRRGADIVERVLGVRPRTFIPPWNRLDSSTLLALRSNGFEIVSAGPFVPVDEGLFALGVECSTDTFPARLERALQLKRRAFLGVIYHSATTRSASEIAKLERAVRLAAESDGCEVLTIRDTVRSYGDEVRMVNAGARNVVPQEEIHGSTRARARLYLRMRLIGRAGRRLESLYVRALDLYSGGEYEEAAGLSIFIDRLAGQVVGTGRALCCGMGCFSGATSAVAALQNMTTGGAIAAGVGSLVGGLGLAAHWQATSSDTRAEIRAVGMFAGAGFVFGVALMFAWALGCEG